MTKATILVVDDEDDIVRAISLRLRAANYEVICANDGFEATRTAIRALPDLVILDIGMPHGNGHVVAQQLLANSGTRSIPIIFLTARTSEEDRMRASGAGGARYLTKPCKSQDLLDTVARALT
jgi:DNA-binding response OmpR family regulator